MIEVVNQFDGHFRNYNFCLFCQKSHSEILRDLSCCGKTMASALERGVWSLQRGAASKNLCISKLMAEYLADYNGLDEATAATSHLPQDFRARLLE